MVVDNIDPNNSKNTSGTLNASFLSSSKSMINKQLYYIPQQDTSFFVVTLYSINTLRLHHVTKVGSAVNSLAMNLFTIEGKVSGFEVHPSNDYLLIVSNGG